ncbi:unnamed protein product, partial [Closterium sp. NIES-53]
MHSKLKSRNLEKGVTPSSVRASVRFSSAKELPHLNNSFLPPPPPIPLFPLSIFPSSSPFVSFCASSHQSLYHKRAPTPEHLCPSSSPSHPPVSPLLRLLLPFPPLPSPHQSHHRTGASISGLAHVRPLPLFPASPHSPFLLPLPLPPISRAIAQELASLGAHVFVCSRGEADVAATVAELQSQGWAATGWACDVKEPEQREVLISKVSEAFGGKLNHLVNNVGTNIRKPTVDYSLSDFHHVWGTNFESAYHLCQLAHPVLKAAANAAAADGGVKGNASIVFNSSVAGVVAIRSGTLYGATKAAMNQLTKNLACEWAKDGIRVNAVAPWYMATDLANQ